MAFCAYLGLLRDHEYEFFGTDGYDRVLCSVSDKVMKPLPFANEIYRNINNMILCGRPEARRLFYGNAVGAIYNKEDLEYYLSGLFRWRWFEPQEYLDEILDYVHRLDPETIYVLIVCNEY